MKKLLLSFTILATFATLAQPAFEVVLVTPANGSTIQAGQLWQYEVTIKNTGNAAHAGFPTDTIIVAPTFNTQIIPGIAWFVPDPIAVGATYTFTDTTGIQGGQPGTINICGILQAAGASYTGLYSTTSAVCHDVYYGTGISIGELQLAQTFDNSYFSNGIYHVNVTSEVELNAPSIEVLDINGRIVLEQDLSAGNGIIEDKVSLEDLVKGMYIVKLGTVDGLISVKKIMY